MMARTNGNPLRAERDAWLRIKYRTRPSSYRFKRYENVPVHPEWLISFEAFISHIGPMPTKEHTLDRIVNEKGYVPGNVRWVTKQVQSRNRRGYGILKTRGVYSEFGKFRATIRVDGKKISLGMFSDLESAIAARQEAEIKYWGEIYPDNVRG